MNNFFRFPHTPHLIWLGVGVPRDDKVLSKTEAHELLSKEVIVEEKIDGANLGISFTSNGELHVQSRGQYLSKPFKGQFKKLSTWIAPHTDDLFVILGDGLILFGEWCAARHSIPYDRLPDWFLAFDVYDKRTGLFFSTSRRETLFRQIGLSPVPILFKKHTTLNELTSFINTQKSAYRSGSLEGIIIRSETDEWLNARAKLVLQDFTSGIHEHWSSRALEWNRLERDALPIKSFKARTQRE
ncbi:MAG TPA: RNA ligase family protein [Deltaproteobacteria bacterium]|nr:RNA ligase family protein [Deltaproteobacteria bacterium]HPA08820.1 RNA ligase family protein [Methanoregulaceae archaeon]